VIVADASLRVAALHAPDAHHCPSSSLLRRIVVPVQGGMWETRSAKGTGQCARVRGHHATRSRNLQGVRHEDALPRRRNHSAIGGVRMKRADLNILIQEGESTTLEFKEGLSGSLAREMVALANTIGGRILLGVRDDGSVAGLKDSNSLRARIQDTARNCDPPIKIVVEPVGEVVVVHVHESVAKPVQCSEGFFWRQGAVTQKLSRAEIRDLFCVEGAIRFDLSPCPRFRYPQDFDRAKYNAWLRLSGISGRPRTEDVLVNIEAAERAGGKLLFRNAGVLFFAKNVRRFFNQGYGTSPPASARQVPDKCPTSLGGSCQGRRTAAARRVAGCFGSAQPRALRQRASESPR